MKAIGYIRVSTQDQANEGVSLDNQKLKIQAYCDLKDITLVEIVEDAGISGKNLNRTGIQKVLQASRKKEIDAVIVYKLDRMFRNTIDALETTKKFDKWGISFHSIQETLDTRSAMGRFFFTIMAGVAEMERGIIGERTRQALQHKKALGEKTGGDIPFGYNVTRNNILIENPAEQKIIELIQRLREKGCSLRAICQELENNNHRTKKGCLKWNPKTVSLILKRPA
ncbi:recombinase family protein [bacterium]|nr:recombinase family protein [bacterium]